jgi:Ca2+-binding EF-hand superfamily protein
LFTDPTSGAITFESLKQIAKSIEEDISDEELYEMLEEASKENSMHGKITEAEFKDVLNRAANSV